ncbi:MAG: hypothetical protein QNJ89_13145 [Acidimicrobiia bacterium]|nr:hypothetical protein [Acidimicrobiia bacterium]
MTDTFAATGWAPTHRAPPEGMDAWQAPDPASGPSDDLAGKVELVVVEESGAWAKVRGENGWEGWVDGRLLEQLDPSGRNPDLRAYVLFGVAVAVLVVLAVLGLVGGS